MPPRILSISQHKTVLETRNAVLRSAGYEVITTMDLSEAERIAKNNGPWAAAVLGDSISYIHRRDLGRQLKDLVPGLCVIAVVRTSDPIPDRSSADLWINSLEGPEKLLEALRSVINAN